jgi:murein DD-endopeptidase MepM/ murein hydrolase activator NlpD
MSSPFLSLTLTFSLHTCGAVKRVDTNLYRRSEFGLNGGSGVAALSVGQIIPAPATFPEIPSDWKSRFENSLSRLDELDIAPDLGTDIGSLRWWRGLFTCTALCAGTVMLAPTYKPFVADAPPVVTGNAWDEQRAQSIAPLAWGGDTGRRMAANDLVAPLNDTPERPVLSLTATLGQGDGFGRVLERAGVSQSDAKRVSALISQEVPLGEIEPGTVIDLTLGRRAKPTVPRPLDGLKLRARIDLSLMVQRSGSQLNLVRIPIAVDRTPLRIQGAVGGSLYRSARAAGAPSKAVESYIKAIASKLSFERDIDPSARFDIIVEQARAETGEIEHGKLLYAGMTRGNRKTQLLQWTIGGNTEWFEATGVGQKRQGMTSPVAGRITSGFGRRFHPILGYSKMHMGVDFGAPTGTPVRAVTDGVIAFAGRNGGYGNHIRVTHNPKFGSSYSHLSRISVRPGERVLQGEVIGYVGSTGMSTGPHLHFEVYRNGQAVNPRTVNFESSSLLSGAELQAFRNRLSRLLEIPVAAR